ncbi:MAG: hypothetical protein KIS89_00465 [Dokdonella sp.]|nr:hypothetical protein [Dokdonella sp.]
MAGTTTTRLLAAIARAGPARRAHLLDGVYRGVALASGDFSSPVVRTALLASGIDRSDPRDRAWRPAAARPAVQHAQVGIVTNVSDDHFGSTAS